MVRFVDTHAHLDGSEFAGDLDLVVDRARKAGVGRVLIPATDLRSVQSALRVCDRFPGYAYPMIGLHPEEVEAGWRETLGAIRQQFSDRFIAIGEVGLDYYWSRDYAREQLEAFEAQVEWAIEVGRPLMIHCRKAQNEMVALLRHYEKELAGGVFHCFTGNAHEAAELLRFERFALGIGGVLTFKKSHLPEVLPQSVPLSRIVLETDAPYMAPVPMRGQRNESAFVAHVLHKLAECYGVTDDEVATQTNQTVQRIFFPGQPMAL